MEANVKKLEQMNIVAYVQLGLRENIVNVIIIVEFTDITFIIQFF